MAIAMVSAQSPCSSLRLGQIDASFSRRNALKIAGGTIAVADLDLNELEAAAIAVQLQRFQQGGLPRG